MNQAEEYRTKRLADTRAIIEDFIRVKEENVLPKYTLEKTNEILRDLYGVLSDIQNHPQISGEYHSEKTAKEWMIYLETWGYRL